MAEYSERTGVVKWQRVVLASQREQIERRLVEYYPIQTDSQIESRRRAPVQQTPVPVVSTVAKKTAKRSR